MQNLHFLPPSPTPAPSSHAHTHTHTHTPASGSLTAPDSSKHASSSSAERPWPCAQCTYTGRPARRSESAKATPSLMPSGLGAAYGGWTKGFKQWGLALDRFWPMMNVECKGQEVARCEADACCWRESIMALLYACMQTSEGSAVHETQPRIATFQCCQPCPATSMHTPCVSQMCTHLYGTLLCERGSSQVASNTLAPAGKSDSNQGHPPRNLHEALLQMRGTAWHASIHT